MSNTNTTRVLASLGAVAGGLAATQAQATIIVQTYTNTSVSMTNWVASPKFDFKVGNTTVFSISDTAYRPSQNLQILTIQAAGPSTTKYLKGPNTNVTPTVTAGTTMAQEEALLTVGKTKNYTITSYYGVLIQNHYTFINFPSTGFIIPPSPNYLLFQFAASKKTTDYGYIHYTASDPGLSTAKFNILSIGYATGGVQIAAGAGAPTPTPEPGTAGLLALGAMVTGAVGMRRFRRSGSAG